MRPDVVDGEGRGAAYDPFAWRLLDHSARPPPDFAASAGAILIACAASHLTEDLLPPRMRLLVAVSVLMAVVPIAIWSLGERRLAGRHDIAARRALLLARARAGRWRPVASSTFFLVVGVLCWMGSGIAHDVLASAHGASWSTHALVDGVPAGVGVASLLWWRAGLRRLDRGGDPGGAWIWAHGHSMPPWAAVPPPRGSTTWPGMVEVATVTTATEAEIIAEILDGEGVSTFISDAAASAIPSLAFGRAVRVLVAEADLTKAKDLLARHERLAEP